MSRTPSRSSRRAARNAQAQAQEKGTRPYGGLSTQERRAERRARLLDAGLALFGTRGYAGTPIELICASANVTARHFYEQFASREDLLLAVYDRIVMGSRQAVLAALHHSQGGPEARISAGLGAYVDAVLDDPRHARIACLEIVGASEKAARRRRASIHEMALIIEAQAQQLAALGDVAPRDFSMTAIALAGAINELITDAIGRPHPPNKRALVEALARLFLAVIADARDGRAPERAQPNWAKEPTPKRTKDPRKVAR